MKTHIIVSEKQEKEKNNSVKLKHETAQESLFTIYQDFVMSSYHVWTFSSSEQYNTTTHFAFISIVTKTDSSSHYLLKCHVTYMGKVYEYSAGYGER